MPDLLKDGESVFGRYGGNIPVVLFYDWIIFIHKAFSVRFEVFCHCLKNLRDWHVPDIPEGHGCKDARADFSEGVNVEHFDTGIASEMATVFKMTEVINRHSVFFIILILQFNQKISFIAVDHQLFMLEIFGRRFYFAEPGFMNAEVFQEPEEIQHAFLVHHFLGQHG